MYMALIVSENIYARCALKKERKRSILGRLGACCTRFRFFSAIAAYKKNFFFLKP
jgi:hypothetical protein